MKAVILAGGLGTRLVEETHDKPKPMVKIGEKPILWHIMKIYSAHGIKDFIICSGYKGYLIKDYFKSNNDKWNVTIVDTGKKTMTGGRLKRVAKYIKDEKNFCFTYGDGIGDINITALIKFHCNHGKKATLTATRPPARFGALKIGSRDIIKEFKEKTEGDGNWINGGFFVLSPDVIDLIEDDNTSWEKDPLNHLVKNKQLYAFKHNGFWQPMDTLREKKLLNNFWKRGNAPWKIWE
jgi:glucose-1-phosphate cytidylyltransferase